MRKREETVLSYSMLIQSILNAFGQLTPLVASSVTFLAMTLTGFDIRIAQVCTIYL